MHKIPYWTNTSIKIIKSVLLVQITDSKTWSLCSHRFRSYLPALTKLPQLCKKHNLSYSLSRGINNLTVKTREINNIKTRHKAIGIDIENLSDKGRSHTPYFRTQDANWDEWCKLLDNNLLQFISSFCNKVSRNILMTNLTYF